MVSNGNHENNTSYPSGLSKGLFGETDRNSGEYYFRSGHTQQVYSNAHYVPVDESTAPPKYYKPVDSPDSAAAAKRKRTGIGFFAVLALCLACALLGGIIGAGITSSKLETRINSLEQVVLPAEMTEAVDEKDENVIRAVASGSEITGDYLDTYSASDIYNLGCRETVCINVETVYRDRSGIDIPTVVSGSGFVITEDGYILTNYHVVQKAAENGFPVTVLFYNGDSYNGEIVGYDMENDLALVKISATGLQTVTLGDSSSVMVGDDVFAIGNPFQILEFTMTSGHISALNRLIATEQNDNAIEMFQIDAAVYEGNSGGPLYNNRGEVIAVVSAKYSEGANYEGIGFAIPINSAKSILTDIMENGFTGGRATLSVDFDERYNPTFSRYYNLPLGAFVSYVYPEKCAEKAGLQAGDIITAIGDRQITCIEDVSSALRKYKPGNSADIQYFREGNLGTASIIFDEDFTTRN